MTVAALTYADRNSPFIEQMADEVLLREAWHRVQRGGKTAGVDGVTVDAFRPHAETRIKALRHALVSGAFIPSPVKRVQIPKAAGGWRLLGIPTVLDRIAHTAAALVLHDRVAVSFSDRSFAYRPFLGPRRAAFFLKTLLPSAEWAVTADIAKFFDNVDHRILAGHLRAAGIDDAGVQFVLKCLRSPIQDGARRFQPVKGLPQGSPVAPVLANLYLTGFDTSLQAEGFTHVRFADDFVILADDQSDADRALRYLSVYLTSRLRLEIKPAKTQMAPLSEGFNFVGFRFTRDRWTVPDESFERFKTELSEAIGGPLLGLPDACRAHNDLVAGWRNYYGGTSPELDQQLEELDGWREGKCRALLKRHGDTAGTGLAWFERLLQHRVIPMAPSGYGPGTAAVDESPHLDAMSDELHRGGMADPLQDRHIFAAERAFRAAEIGRRQVPELLDGGWLRMPTYGAFVSKSQALLVVRRKKQVLFECAFDELTGVAVESDGAVVSTGVIAECARRGIPLTFSRVSGKPFARVAAARSSLDAQVVQRQVRFRAGRSGLPIAKSILLTKLSNQRALLLYHRKYRARPSAVRDRLMASAAAIAECRGAIESLASAPLRTARKSLFLIEAHAAAHYWEAFAALLPPALGFRKRMHRDATDIVNKSLNYGYAILLNRMWVAVHHAGLEPALGLVHTGRRRTPGLVFDLMEPFRQPVVDRTVLALIGRGARLSVNQEGELSLRTRSLLNQAFSRRLMKGRPDLDTDIRKLPVSFRRSLERGGPLSINRMSW